MSVFNVKEIWVQRLLTEAEKSSFIAHCDQLSDKETTILWMELAQISSKNSTGASNIKLMHPYFGPRILSAYQKDPKGMMDLRPQTEGS